MISPSKEATKALYHGTTKDVVKAISREGLKIKYTGQVYKQSFREGTEGVIFATESAADAEHWARGAAWKKRTDEGVQPAKVILRIEVPESKMAAFELDKVGMADLGSSSDFRRLMTQKDIPPEWIAEITELSY
jgi:hypothetical protein